MKTQTQDDREGLLREGTLGVAQVVRETGVGRTTIYAAMHAGELPFVKIGRRTVIPRRALRTWLARNLQQHAGA